jgi:hydrogenase-4 component A
LLAWEPGVKSIAVKCDLCGFRESGPVCAEVCPTEAIVLVDEGATETAGSVKREQAALTEPAMPIVHMEKEN